MADTPHLSFSLGDVMVSILFIHAARQGFGAATPKRRRAGWRRGVRAAARLVATLCLTATAVAAAAPGDAAPAKGAVAAPAPAPAVAGPPRPAPEVVTRVSERPLRIEDVPAAKRFVTKHSTRIRGRDIAYSAIAGETLVTDLYGEPTASIFSFSYIADAPSSARRPVMFIFNGGPGSSSVWLHMGVVGPRRVVLDREVNPSNTPPFGYENNPYSPLDVADLVFIDPVGTGFSHAVGHARENDFYGVEEDADTVARFIEAWLTEHGRWNSPKYLMGESYGGTRAALLPRALLGGPFYGGVLRGITVNGIVLVSPSLSTGGGAGDSDLRTALALPGLAVSAWYHNRIERGGRSAAEHYETVKQFALTEYRDALARLAKGSLGAADKSAVAARLAAATGVPADVWLRRDLRISDGDFRRMLLRGDGLEVGAYDARYTMPLANSGGDPVADDPSMAKYTPGFIAAFHQMIRRELKVDMRIPYNAITFADLNFVWRYNRPAAGPAATPVGDLAMAMRRTADLRVLVASGYYDFVTSPAATEHDLAKSQLPADRLFIRNYESGHMLYLGETAEAFANDVRGLVENNLR